MASIRAPTVEFLRAFRQVTINPTSTGGLKAITCPHSRRVFSMTRCRLADNKTPSVLSTTPSALSNKTPLQSQNPSQRGTNPFAPKSLDRGPESKEDTQTDFGVMDIFANTPEPATSIDACTPSTFHLNNGRKTASGAAVLLAGGEAWNWRPWLSVESSSTSSSTSSDSNTKISALLDAKKRILHIPPAGLSLLTLLHPKPDLLILGTGAKVWMLAPETKKYLMEELGIRVDVMDTANASAAYNLLATERGVEGGSGIAGGFLPVGWVGPSANTTGRSSGTAAARARR